MGLKESFLKFIPSVNFGEESMVAKASDGITRDAWYAETWRKQGNPPPENLNLMLQIFNEDPIVNTAVTTRVNAMLDSGWTIEGRDTPKSEAERILKKVGFDYAFLRQLFLNALLYRHVFTEIERDGEREPVGLHILETTQMEIEHTKHGEIEKYLQRAVTGEIPEWQPEEVTYIPYDKLSTDVWGTNGLQSLYRTITTRNNIEEFLNSLSVINAWRDVIKVRRMNKDDIGSYISYLRDAQADPAAPFVVNQPAEGEIGMEPMRSSDDLNNFMELLSYLRSQILMLYKVPPIMVGLPDNSNRSNSETQFKSFNIANESDRIITANAINNDLFPKLGISNSVKFVWNPIDDRSEKDDVEMAEKLMNMGAKPKKVEQFLRDSGLDLPDDFFDENAGMQKTPDDAASRPSRQRTDDEESEKIGTGSESTTREEQL